jgi:hypothetical protein
VIHLPFRFPPCAPVNTALFIGIKETYLSVPNDKKKKTRLALIFYKGQYVGISGDGNTVTSGNECNSIFVFSRVQDVWTQIQMISYNSVGRSGGIQGTITTVQNIAPMSFDGSSTILYFNSSSFGAGQLGVSLLSKKSNGTYVEDDWLLSTSYYYYYHKSVYITTALAMSGNLFS